MSGINVCFGSSAAPRDPTSSRAAFGGKAEVKNAGNHEFEGPESANSGHSWQFGKLPQNGFGSHSVNLTKWKDLAETVALIAVVGSLIAVAF